MKHSIILLLTLNLFSFDLITTNSNDLESFSITPKSTPKGEVFHNAYDYLASLKSSNAIVEYALYDQDAKVKNKKILDLSGISGVGSVNKNSTYYFIYDDETLFALDDDLEVAKTIKLGKKSKIFTTNDHIYALSTTPATFDAKDPFSAGFGGSDLRLSRYDMSLLEAKSRSFGTRDDDTAISVVANGDRIFALASAKSKAVLYIFDQDLKLLSKNEFDNIKPKALDLAEDSLIITLEELGFMQVDLSGKIVKQKSIKSRYKSEINGLKRTKDGYIACGSVVDGSDTDALVMKLDETLTLVDQAHFGSLEYQSFSDIKPLNDGTFIAFGVDESRAFVLKLSSDLVPIK